MIKNNPDRWRWMAVIFGFLMLLGCSHPSEIYKVRREHFEARLVETGELQAVHSAVISPPMMGWRSGIPKIIRMAEQGQAVKPGDTLIVLDNSTIYKLIQESEGALTTARTNLQRIRLDQAGQLSQIKMEEMTAQNTYTLSKIQLDKIGFESENKQKVEGYRFQQATLAFERLKRKHQFVLIQQKIEMQIAQLTVQKAERDLVALNKSIEKTVILAEGHGLVDILINPSAQPELRPYQIGDQVWFGNPVLRLPDVRTMKAITYVAQEDVFKLRPGQNALIRLDAFPEQSFKGKVTRISYIGQTITHLSRRKVHEVEILMESSDPILKPGMTVRCEIETAKLDNVLVIENECLIRVDSRHYLMTLKGGKIIRIPVRKIFSNNSFSVIDNPELEGLQAIPADRIGDHDAI